MMSPSHNPNQNRLLAALPTAEFDRLAVQLKLIPMPHGKILYEPGKSLQFAYFLTTATVSLHCVLESGASTETTGVGSEGMVGITLFMGEDTTRESAIVQTAGHAYQIERCFLIQEFNRSGWVQHLLLRYTKTLIAQMTQTAACNRHHSIEQRLCRYLLLTLDRLPSSELALTHELVASMLGVRREGVTEAAGKLQRAGFIRYRRGHITVLDRFGLETRTCECYAVLRRELSHFLSGMQNSQGIVAATRHLPAVIGSSSQLFTSG